ncbi:MAG: hypothetical protein KIH89_000700 [Candidatus Shapirobacteria bacterium]|nr:hypothetical protein [Candidatus Shapirobacteria bacterium]
MRKKIKAKWIIKVSGEVKFLVKNGEKVSRGQVVAKIKPKIIESFNFSEFLGKMSQDSLDKLNEKFKNTWVNNGDLVCLTGGVFPKKICFPMSGNFLGIDEFGNLKIEKVEDKEKEILSPVESSVLKIEEDKIILEFEAKEFKGEGLVEGKSWSRGEIGEINNLKDLSSTIDGGILFTNNLSKAFLLKAEVVGAVAVVTKTELSESIDVNLPVLKIIPDDWDELLSISGEKSILINSRVGRLLMVLE